MKYTVIDVNRHKMVYHGFMKAPLLVPAGSLIVMAYVEGDIDGMWLLDKESAINELRSYYESKEFPYQFTYLLASDWR